MPHEEILGRNDVSHGCVFVCKSGRSPSVPLGISLISDGYVKLYHLSFYSKDFASAMLNSFSFALDLGDMLHC